MLRAPVQLMQIPASSAGVVVVIAAAGIILHSGLCVNSGLGVELEYSDSPLSSINIGEVYRTKKRKPGNHFSCRIIILLLIYFTLDFRR